MEFEMAGLLKTRAQHGVDWWVKHKDPELSEELLDTMRLFMEAAENYSHVDAGKDKVR
jgi:spatacsin